MTISITVDGRIVATDEHATVAAVLLNESIGGFRRSASGEPRGPLCGMGVCQECRVTIDDVSQQRACLVVVRNGMRVTTIGGRPS